MRLPRFLRPAAAAAAAQLEADLRRELAARAASLDVRQVLQQLGASARALEGLRVDRCGPLDPVGTVPYVAPPVQADEPPIEWVAVFDERGRYLGRVPVRVEDRRYPVAQ